MDPCFEQRLIHLLRRIARRLYMQSRNLVRECGLTAPQLIVLEALVREGELSVNALAEQAALSPATVSGILDRLEARELVQRRRCTHDRRSVLVNASSQTRELLSGGLSVVTTDLSARLSSLPGEDKQSILHALDTLASLLDEGSSVSTPPAPTEARTSPVIPPTHLMVDETRT